MEGVEIRPATLDELPDLYRVCSRAIGFPMASEERLEHLRKHFDCSRSLATFDRGQMVATAHSWSFEWTLPGGQAVPAAGVTLVSVAATHRRRGILTQVMRRQLTEARERGEPVAILLASESVIYGRFGYGLSTTVVDIDLDPRIAKLTPGAAPGRVRFVDDATADGLLPTVYDRWRRSQHGAIDRSPDWWTGSRVEHKPESRPTVVYESPDGEAEGYAIYSLEPHWEAGLPDHTLSVGEHVAVTPEAAAALWEHVMGVDLVSKVKAWTRPPDEPLRWRLSDPRRMRVTRSSDFLWARILDVPRMLSGRRYDAPGRLVLEVRDPMFPDVDGRYELDAFPEGADCVGTSADPDLVLGIAELGAVFQGGVRFSDLARVGRIREETPGSLAVADRMFTTRPAPWSNTGF